MARQEIGEKPKHKTPTRDDDLGTNYPADYLLRPFNIWYDSGLQVWPNGRSYDEQDPQLVDDFFEMLHELNYQIWALKNPDEQRPPAPTFEDLFGNG